MVTKMCDVCEKWPARFRCYVCKAEMCKECAHFCTRYAHHVAPPSWTYTLPDEPLPEKIEKTHTLLCQKCYNRFGFEIHEHILDYLPTPALDRIKREPAKGKVHAWGPLIGWKKETTQGTAPLPKKKPARRGKKRVAVDPLLQMAMEDDDG